LINKSILVIFLSLLLVLVGCAEEENGTDLPGFNDETMPAVIEAWVENSLTTFVGQTYSYDDQLYILVTYGLKPTGGYAVEITDVEIAGDRVIVSANFSVPGEDEMVTEALTYPYDLAVIENPGLPVEFVAEGAESYLPTLNGLDHLNPIAAESQWIKIFKPAPGDSVIHSFTVEGIANVFEGTVNYSLTAPAEKILTEGYTMGAMGDWGYFSFEIEITEEIESGAPLLLELYTLSPKDGSVQDLIQIELTAP
jgi:hypothetical protein